VAIAHGKVFEIGEFTGSEACRAGD
jgi:hypothetical protein